MEWRDRQLVEDYRFRWRPRFSQVDTRYYEMCQRIENLFENQKDLLQSRALIPHDISCNDPLMCLKENCWTWEPDKIVSEPYIVKRENGN